MRRPRVNRSALPGILFLALVLGLAATFMVVLVKQDDRADNVDRQLAAVAEALTREQEATVADGGQPVTPPVRDIIDEPDVIVGEPGKPGERGDRGAQGPTGPAGATGADGEDAVTPTCATTPPNYCVGAPGATGAAGQPGVGTRGPQGLQGPQGETGAVGATGPAGPQGSPGVDGAAGSQGPQGIQGPAGVDAPRPARVLLPATLGRQQECDLVWTAERLEAVNCSIV